MNFPENLRYTKDHEWVALDGNVATVGITDFAQRELGDIVYIDIGAKGKSLGAEEVLPVAGLGPLPRIARSLQPGGCLLGVYLYA